MDQTPVRHSSTDPALGDILALIKSSYAYMQDRIDPPSSMHRLTLAGIARHCDTGEVWSIGTPPMACMFLTPQRDSLYLGKLAVSVAHRHQGLARTLITQAARRALALGKRFLELEARIELTENHRAFTRLGFQKTAEAAHPGYDHPTFIVMRKPVGGHI